MKRVVIVPKPEGSDKFTGEIELPLPIVLTSTMPITGLGVNLIAKSYLKDRNKIDEKIDALSHKMGDENRWDGFVKAQ